MATLDVFREVIPLSDEDCFDIAYRTKTHFTYPIHVHPEYELNFIENAKGAKRIVGDSVEEIDDLELCLIGNRKLEHGWIDADRCFDEVHEITIQFHPDIFLNSLLSKRQFQSLSIMFENAKKGIVFSRPIIEKVKCKLENLMLNQDGFHSVLDLITILYELSYDEQMRILCNNEFASEDDISESMRIQKILNFLQENYQKDIKLADVAAFVGMTEVLLSRFVKKRIGKKFIDYVIDFRLGIASRSLINSQKSIAVICSECGFNNLSNFNRVFKRRKGVTPKEFRKKYSNMRKLI